MFLILSYSKKVSKKPSTNEGLFDLYLKTVLWVIQFLKKPIPLGNLSSHQHQNNRHQQQFFRL